VSEDVIDAYDEILFNVTLGAEAPATPVDRFELRFHVPKQGHYDYAVDGLAPTYVSGISLGPDEWEEIVRRVASVHRARQLYLDKINEEAAEQNAADDAARLERVTAELAIARAEVQSLRALFARRNQNVRPASARNDAHDYTLKAEPKAKGKVK
jgi:hypothetical protein